MEKKLSPLDCGVHKKRLAREIGPVAPPESNQARSSRRTKQIESLALLFFAGPFAYHVKLYLVLLHALLPFLYQG